MALWKSRKSKKEKPNWFIRWLIRRDLPEVLDIERTCFGERAWDEDEFIQWLQHRTTIGLVVEGSDNEVVAYVIYEFLRDKLDIVNIAVDPNVQRCGIGKLLVEKLISKTSEGNGKRNRRLETLISETNLPSQLFFRAQGFQCIAVRHDVETDGAEDECAYQMVYQPNKQRGKLPTHRFTKGY